MTTKGEDELPLANDRMHEIAQLLRDCRTALNTVSFHTLWQPTPGSAAESVKTALDAQPSTESGADQFTLVSDAVQTLLITAGQHLGAISALFDAGEVFVSPPVLARSVLECCAQGMWVIGRGDDPLPMLARAYLQEHMSAIEANKAASRMRPGSESAVDAKNRLKRVRKEMEAIFPGTDTNAPAPSGQTMLSPEKGVTWMFDFFTVFSGSTITSKEAQGTYDFLSNHTHPTLYAVRQLRRWAEHDGHAHGTIEMDPEFLETLASAAIVGFYNALGYAMSFFGADRSAHDALTAQIDATMPRIFTPESS